MLALIGLGIVVALGTGADFGLCMVAFLVWLVLLTVTDIRD